MKKVRRIVWRVTVAVAILLLASFIAGVLVLRSGWFHERVRQRIIAEIEKATGGRVELGSFRFDTKHLTATVGPLVLHGEEPPGEPPLLSAQSVKVGLRILSMVERKVDLSSLRLQQPRVRIVFYADGSNNLLPPHRGNWAEELINVAVRNYEVVDGVLEYDDRQIPLNIRGEDLRLQMKYDSAGPLYRGDLASRNVRVSPAGYGPIQVDTAAAFTLDKSAIHFTRLHLATQESHADLTGVLYNPRAPHGTFEIKAAGAVREAASLFQLQIAHAGTATFDGKLSISFEKKFDFGMTGRFKARGIGYVQDRLKIENADARGDLRLNLDGLTLRNVTATALGSTINGQVDLLKWKTLHFDGRLEGLNVRDAARIVTDRPVAWNGTLAGGFGADAVLGQSTAKVLANLAVTPAGEGTPIEGQLEVGYDQAAGSVKLGNSYLKTPATRIDVAGTLGDQLQIHAQTTNLDDLLPALAMASDDAPKELPLKLNHGHANFAGTISGPLDNPHAAGRAEVTSAVYEGHAFDRFAGDVDAGRQSVRVQRMVLARGATEIGGSVEIKPREGKFEDAAVRTSRCSSKNPLRLENSSIAFERMSTIPPPRSP